MLVQGNEGARISNRINKLYPEHFIWINSQIKANKYLATRGREVFIKKVGTSSAIIVNIPPKGDPNYFNAWIDVYNYALDYLEGMINYACKENFFIKKYNNKWLLNGKVITWPIFDETSSNYAIGLDRIFDEYAKVKINYMRSAQSKNAGIDVKSSSTYLTKADEVKLPKEVNYNDIKPSRQSSFVKKSDLSNSKLVFIKNEPVLVEKEILIQKVSDGDVLDTRDISKLRSSKTDIVVLTCQDVLAPKEEDIFLENVNKCQSEGFKIGAFIYGKGENDHTAAIEIKRIIKLLSKCSDGFSGLVIYSIDNDYILKNKESDINLLNFINIYNSVVNTLKQYGYSVMISMSLESGKIIQDINERYNMQNEHDVIYMTFVRDISDVNENTSTIVVDPGNDFDIVNIKNKELINEICNKDLNKKI